VAENEQPGSGKSTTAPAPGNVVTAPVRRTTQATEARVDTTQNYDGGNEPKGLGKEGFRQVGDPVVKAPRHEGR
jgi:hypothetical protein